MPPKDLPGWVDHLYQGGLMVVPSQGLVESFTFRYHRFFKGSVRFWPSPRIVTWADWLRDAYERLFGGEFLTLLSGKQKSLLLEEMLEGSDDFLGTPPQKAWRDRFFEADALMVDYQMESLKERYPFFDAEFELFLELRSSFKMRLQELGALDEVDLKERLLQTSTPFFEEKEVWWVGDFRLTPWQKRFRDHLGQLGTKIVCHTLGELDDSSKVVLKAFRFEHCKEQLQKISEYCCDFLERHPKKKITLIVKDLASSKKQWKRSLALAQLEKGCSFEIAYSLGDPLIETVLGRTWFLLFSWLVRPLRWHEVSQLLLSFYHQPFFLASHDAGWWERGLRRCPEQSWSLADFLESFQAKLDRERAKRADEQIKNALKERMASGKEATLDSEVTPGVLVDPAGRTISGGEGAPSPLVDPDPLEALTETENQDPWLYFLQNFYEDFCELDPEEGSQPFFDFYHLWLERWLEQIALAQDTYTFQCVKKLREHAFEIQHFSQVKPEIDAADFASWVEFDLAQRVFEPQRENPRLSLMGCLEALGKPLGHTIVVDMDQYQWPGRLNYNPFIPGFWQREQKVTHCHGATWFAWHDYLWQNLLRQSQTLLACYYSIDEESGTEQLPSPWWSWCEQEGEPMVFQDKEREPSGGSFAIERPEQPLEALSLEKSHYFEGGTSLLTYFSQCPFKGQMRYRLGVRELENPRSFVDARERGTLLHSALQAFWERAKSSSSLQKLSAEQWQEHFESAVDFALKTLEKSSRLKLSKIYFEIEKKNLYRVLEKAVSREMQLRSGQSFKVFELEKKQRVKVGSLELMVILDRVDLVGRSYLLIDYKSSSKDFRRLWFGERPQDPQLPLYTAFYRDKVEGLAYLEIPKHQRVELTGLESGEINLNSLTLFEGILFPNSDTNLESWELMVDYWKDRLENLSSHFLSGYSAVDPRPDETHCKHCGYALACRIQERERRGRA